MNYNIEFQIAGLLIAIGIFSTYFFSKANALRSSLTYKIFFIHLCTLIVNLMFDIVSVITISERENLPPLLVTFFAKGYIISMLVWITLTLFFVFAVVYGRVRTKRGLFLCNCAFRVLGAACIAMCIVVLCFPVLYEGHGRLIYSYGIPSICTYIYSAVCVAITFAFLLFFSRQMSKYEILPIMGFVCMEGIVALVQSLNPYLLILGIGSALTEFLMFRSLEIISSNDFQQEIIHSFSDLIEGRDESTGGHVKRTRAYVRLILEEIQKQKKFARLITRDYIETVVESATIHDIGKITIPDSILQKQGRLTAEEYDIMKTHTTNGAELVKDSLNKIGTPEWTRVAYDMAYSHHERWDGTGYPRGLKKDEIPLAAQVMAISDVFDAISQDRCYRKKMSLDESFSIIQEGTGTHFNPEIVNAFLKARDKVVLVYKNFEKTAESVSSNAHENQFWEGGKQTFIKHRPPQRGL